MTVKWWHPVFVIVVVFLALWLIVPAAADEARPVASQEDRRTPVPTATATPGDRKSWVTLPPMPASASQADYGAELFRLVCRDCHGDKGQGLTYAWRATWGPDHQDCWQSKCHALNHPPDGFEIPQYIWPIIGPGTLRAYETAADLFAYLRDYQPWYNPGSMTDEENWQLTAFLLRENGIDLAGAPLEPVRAASVLVDTGERPDMATTTPESPAAAWPWVAALVVMGAAIVVAGIRWLR